MKKHIKGIIIGFLLAILLFGSVMTVTGANLTWKKIDVAYDNYKIYVDGVLFEATDKNGVIESFSYNGWIFSPFEHIARALGRSVTWDGKTNSLYIGKLPPPPSVENMTDVAPAYQWSYMNTTWSYYYTEYSAKKSGGTEKFKMAGVTYMNGFTFENGGGDDVWAVYNLNGNFKKVSATLCHVDGKGTSGGVIQIFLDNVLYKEIPVSADMAPMQLDIDIIGVKQLKIVMTKTSFTSYGFGNPVLS